MSELESLPPDLRTLFADERDAYTEDVVARARVMRRIQASVAFGGAAVVAGVAAKTGLFGSLALHLAKYAKLWVAVALASGIVLGETHARLSAPRPSPPSPPLVPVSVPALPAPPTAPAITASLGPSNEPAAVPPSSLPGVSSLPPLVSSASAGPSDLAAEQTLIDTARAALSRGRAADALRVTEEHTHRFPRGRLAEERETLAIQALLIAGRRVEAEARAQRFHKVYPGSLYGNAVDALLAPREDGGR